MPSDWRNIRSKRSDITDYVIHWTHGVDVNGKRQKALDVLKKIVSDGYLMPTFAPRQRFTVGGVENTIQGDFPAVCFTEQPLSHFIVSCATLSSRYQPYGVVLHKWHLYIYGARPVLYGDENLLNSLDDGYKYLWVRYHPVPHDQLRYPVDWTHEREWRARITPYHYLNMGLTPNDGVPLLLPPAQYPGSKKPVMTLPRFLVNDESEAVELKNFLAKLPTYLGNNGFLKEYFEKTALSHVIPLQFVKKNLERGDTRWQRIETLPFEELSPSTKIPTPEKFM